VGAFPTMVFSTAILGCWAGGPSLRLPVLPLIIVVFSVGHGLALKPPSRLDSSCGGKSTQICTWFISPHDWRNLNFPANKQAASGFQRGPLCVSMANFEFQIHGGQGRPVKSEGGVAVSGDRSHRLGSKKIPECNRLTSCGCQDAVCRPPCHTCPPPGCPVAHGSKAVAPSGMNSVAFGGLSKITRKRQPEGRLLRFYRPER